jgi:choice-of-anchor A domain-containing protein
MTIRRAGAVGSARRAVLRLESLEERCVPSATDLGAAGDFNAFVLADFRGNYSDVQGRLAAGHNAALTGYGIGDGLPNSHGTRDDLVVGHNLYYTRGQVFNGNVVYGNAGTLTSVGLLNGTARKGSVVDFTAAAADLTAKSVKWGAYGTTGTISNYYGNLTLTGHGTINVFDLTAAQLATAASLTINVPNGATVLVNVSGTTATLKNFGINLNGADAGGVLFNFTQATTVTLSGIGFRGSILAPHATVNFNNGNLTGVLVARSFCGSGQLNLTPLHLVIPESLPATLSGKVFDDKNGDGIQEAGEAGIGNVTMILQGQTVAVAANTPTTPDGHFTFSDLPPGTYTVAVIVPDGYTVVSVHLGSEGGNPDVPGGETTDIPLGNGVNGVEYDFGLHLPGEVILD